MEKRTLYIDDLFLSIIYRKCSWPIEIMIRVLLLYTWLRLRLLDEYNPQSDSIRAAFGPRPRLVTVRLNFLFITPLLADHVDNGFSMARGFRANDTTARESLGS